MKGEVVSEDLEFVASESHKKNYFFMFCLNFDAHTRMMVLAVILAIFLGVQI